MAVIFVGNEEFSGMFRSIKFIYYMFHILFYMYRWIIR